MAKASKSSNTAAAGIQEVTEPTTSKGYQRRYQEQKDTYLTAF